MGKMRERERERESTMAEFAKTQGPMYDSAEKPLLPIHFRSLLSQDWHKATKSLRYWIILVSPRFSTFAILVYVKLFFFLRLSTQGSLAKGQSSVWRDI